MHNSFILQFQLEVGLNNFAEKCDDPVDLNFMMG